MAFYLHDKARIEQELRRNVLLNLYALGDLDDFFWPFTCWHAGGTSDSIEAIALLYAAPQLPTLIAMTHEKKPMHDLLTAITHLLPRRFYAHLSPGLESALSGTYAVEFHGDHMNMGLVAPEMVMNVPCQDAIGLGTAELPEIEEFYARCYPGNWFDRRMLETGRYYGIRNAGKLVSVAGVHVYSPRYKIAALGNIATDPLFRGMGHARQLVARICQELLREGCQIGLKVKSDNIAAVSCYKKLGFAVVSDYIEYVFAAK